MAETIRHADSAGNLLLPLNPKDQERLDKLNHINTMLMHAFTVEGVAMWWCRPRRQLGGEPPIDHLASGGSLDELIALAEGGLESGGT